jgi:hypothetical protein
MEYQATHMLSGALALPDREGERAVAVIEMYIEESEVSLVWGSIYK